VLKGVKHIMKEQILKLRSEGKSYDQIVAILKCSHATVWYHCNPTAKKERQRLNQQAEKQWRVKIKQMFGAKCQICSYSKCLSALEFHPLKSTKQGVL
jgi:hypothetical protein